MIIFGGTVGANPGPWDSVVQLSFPPGRHCPLGNNTFAPRGNFLPGVESPPLGGFHPPHLLGQANHDNCCELRFSEVTRKDAAQAHGGCNGPTMHGIRLLETVGPSHTFNDRGTQRYHGHDLAISAAEFHAYKTRRLTLHHKNSTSEPVGPSEIANDVGAQPHHQRGSGELCRTSMPTTSNWTIFHHRK